MSVSCFCFAAGKRHSFSAHSAAQDAGLILWINMTPIRSELLSDGSWYFMMESLQELEVGTGFNAQMGIEWMSVKTTFLFLDFVVIV